VTLQQTATAHEINESGHYDSARVKIAGPESATWLQEIEASGGQPDCFIGSAHDGRLVIASASGSQFASYASGAANVVFVVGAQELDPSVSAADDRVFTAQPRPERRPRHRRLSAAQLSRERPGHPPGLPGRIHVVLICQVVGF
jgi:hypothetical protein